MNMNTQNPVTGDGRQVRSDGWMKAEFVPHLFSVIVPTFNRARTIVCTLDSVKVQTYRPIEIIVVDDGSTDETQDVVEDWRARNTEGESFVVEYIYQQNSGAGAARNLGLRVCRGEFIQFLDSDDLLHEKRFERVARRFQRTSCDLVETGFAGFYEQVGDLDEVHYGHEGLDLLAHLLRGRLWPNTLRYVFRRELLKRTGPWNERMSCFEDYEYLIRALVQNPRPRAEAIRDVLCYARRHRGEGRSARLRTREGREWRVHCEAVLCDLVNQCDDIPNEWKQALASRLYGLGFRCNAAGWPDLGQRCGEIAASLEVELDLKGKLRYLAWRGGRLGGMTYIAVGKLKQAMS